MRTRSTVYPSGPYGLHYGPRPSWRRRAAGYAGRAGWRLAKAGMRTGFTYRSWLWPTHLTLGMAATSTALGVIEDGAATAVVLIVLAGVALGWSQWRAWQRLGEPWLIRSVVLSWCWWAAAGSWTVAASADDWSLFAPPIPGLLGAGWFISQLAWFIHRKVEMRRALEAEGLTDTILDTPEYLEAPEPDARVETWLRKIAQPGGALPGAQLIGIKDLDDDRGWQALIRLPDDDAQSTETAIAAVRRIAKAYRVPTSQVVVEPPLDGMEDTARLLLLTRNPLAKPQVFSGPTLDLATGQFSLGIHADSHPAPWRLWTPGSGVNHGMVAGTTGAGKSGLLRTICCEIVSSGRALLLLADPEGGSSVGDWQLGAHCFAGTVPRIRRMLRGALRIMNARKRRRGGATWVDDQGRTRRGYSSFEPTPEEPAVYVVIDEAPDVLADPECREIIAQIGKKGRKHGVAVIIFVQIPSLSELGGDLAVRAMLSSVNIVIFRTSDKLSAQMGLPMKLPIDPANLPAFFPDGSSTAGLGYVASAGGRVSPIRASYQPDPVEWVGRVELIPVPENDRAAFGDDAGNLFDQWRELLDVQEDDEEEAAEIVSGAGGYTFQNEPVTGDTIGKIQKFLSDRAAAGQHSVRPSVIADNIGMSRPGTNNALRRMEKKGLVVHMATSRCWALPQHAEESEMATSGAA